MKSFLNRASAVASTSRTADSQHGCPLKLVIFSTVPLTVSGAKSAEAAAVAEQVRDKGAVRARCLLAAQHDGEAGLQLLGLGAEKRDSERPLEQQVVDAGVGTKRLHPGKRFLRHHRDDHARVGQGHGKV
eukprot:1892705-Rhodomonas_salina.1